MQHAPLQPRQAHANLQPVHRLRVAPASRLRLRGVGPGAALSRWRVCRCRRRARGAAAACEEATDVRDERGDAAPIRTDTCGAAQFEPALLQQGGCMSTGRERMLFAHARRGAAHGPRRSPLADMCAGKWIGFRPVLTPHGARLQLRGLQAVQALVELHGRVAEARAPLRERGIHRRGRLEAVALDVQARQDLQRGHLRSDATMVFMGKQGSARVYKDALPLSCAAATRRAWGATAWGVAAARFTAQAPLLPAMGEPLSALYSRGAPAAARPPPRARPAGHAGASGARLRRLQMPDRRAGGQRPALGQAAGRAQVPLQRGAVQLQQLARRAQLHQRVEQRLPERRVRRLRRALRARPARALTAG